MTLWTFSKGRDRLAIQPDRDKCLLVVDTPGNGQRQYSFKDVRTLDSFHASMEAFLLRTGWTLLTYSPERRRGRDRRGFPRLAERRRWWTDSTELSKVVWGG